MLGAPNICQAGFGFEIHKMAVTGKFDSALLQITVVATGVEVSDYQQGCRIKILRKFKTPVEESSFLVQLGEIRCAEIKSCKFCKPKLTFFSASRCYAREFERLLGSDQYGVGRKVFLMDA